MLSIAPTPSLSSFFFRLPNIADGTNRTGACTCAATRSAPTRRAHIETVRGLVHIGAGPNWMRRPPFPIVAVRFTRAGPQGRLYGRSFCPSTIGPQTCRTTGSGCSALAPKTVWAPHYFFFCCSTRHPYHMPPPSMRHRRCGAPTLSSDAQNGVAYNGRCAAEPGRGAGRLCQWRGQVDHDAAAAACRASNRLCWPAGLCVLCAESQAPSARQADGREALKRVARGGRVSWATEDAHEVRLALMSAFGHGRSSWSMATSRVQGSPWHA